MVLRKGFRSLGVRRKKESGAGDSEERGQEETEASKGKDEKEKQ